jgi:acyl-ACP thioesterase
MIETEKILPIHKMTVQVKDGDVDFRRQMTFTSLFSYMQDAAGLHSAILGIDSDTLTERGVAWILMRMFVDVVRMPKIFENIIIETWPQRPSAHCERDFLIRDENGKVIIRALSIWIIMDIEKREILRNPGFSYPDIDFIMERAIKEPLKKLKTPGKSEIAGERPITYSIIDLNRHLNNSRYLDLIMDCLGMDFIENNNIDSVEINYVGEVQVGDTMILGIDRSEIDDGVIYVEGGSKNERKTSFRSKIVFTEIV